MGGPGADDPVVRLAFAGAGWIAAVHGFASAHVEGLAVTRVASRDPERAARIARHLAAEPCGYDDLPGDAGGVVVCTPPALHAEHALAAVEAGAAALVEKPLCATLADADRLVDATDAGGRIAYAENLVFAPAVRTALQRRRLLGDLTHLEVRALQPRPEWGDFLTEGWGGGVLFDLGAHPLAVALLLAAPATPTSVTAELHGADDHPVDEHARVWITFDTGLVATVEASWRNGAGEVAWDAQAASEGGALRLVLLPAIELELNGVAVPLPAAPAGVPPELEQLGYLPQLESFALDVAEQRIPTLGAAFGRQVLDLTCAAYASAATGDPVELPFDGPRDRTPLQLWRGG
jgi:myo-inositol 2-dehydrogenase / D-chiro-inositol 1-dehydrogenase